MALSNIHPATNNYQKLKEKYQQVNFLVSAVLQTNYFHLWESYDKIKTSYPVKHRSITIIFSDILQKQKVPPGRYFSFNQLPVYFISFLAACFNQNVNLNNEHMCTFLY